MNLQGYKPLVIFGCVHIGAKTADLGMAKKYVDFVRHHKSYALLLADNHECALPHKGGMVFEQDKIPQEQYEYGVELFRPISKNIVGACTGNHANRAYRVAGMDLDRCMAQSLGYLRNYFPWQGYVSVKVGKMRYSIAFKHGNGVGSDDFRNCRQLEASFPSADILCSSHTHKLASTNSGFWTIRNGSRHFHQTKFITTGSLLNYPRYADEAGYKPQPKGFAIAWLSPDKYDVFVDTSGVI